MAMRKIRTAMRDSCIETPFSADHPLFLRYPLASLKKAGL
jgi:hypothetical protein